VLTGVGTIALAAAVLVRLSGLLTFPSALAAVLPVVAGGALLSRSVPRDDSPGAVDNASGMIAVLAAAEALPARSDVGVLITGAEEFGMAGAKVWTAGAQRGERFVNVDGVDARGTVRIMVHRGDRDQRRAAARLADQLMKGFEQEGIRARIGPLPPGILVDGVVLAAAGMPGVSVSRGDWRTLGVIHTKRDTASRTDPDTAIRVGRTIAAVLGGQLG
jgi:Zn-dependent M28 family amino/carboxypeptidase